MPEYLALIYADEGDWDGLPEADRDAMLARYGAFADEAAAAGALVGGEELQPTRAATSVRVRDGQVLVTDGPYADVKEALGGYFVLRCDSIDEAVGWAARIPGAEHGAVEVRPVHEEA